VGRREIQKIYGEWSRRAFDLEWVGNFEGRELEEGSLRRRV